MVKIIIYQELSTEECSDEEFKCPTGECILRMAVCDAYADCSNGEDELDCECARNEVGLMFFWGFSENGVKELYDFDF